MTKLTETSFNGLERNIVTTNIKCPRCESRNLELNEQVEATTTFLVKDGQFDRNEGWHETGGINGVWAQCARCKHGWTVRKAGQIDDCIAKSAGRIALKDPSHG